MANIKSAIKRAKTNEIRRARRASQKSAMRTSVKKFLVALEQNQDNAAELLQQATRALDKAVTKGLIHKNAAARKKSRLMKKFNAVKAQA
ncbi:30S ribosomal protein S20 [Staphylospora marina]|uniref:30S ribosomal protein S20 n=1 Tax=Staphylospora marina TaxID=2490858 RepID=UPI000F5C22E2|nr:30S ribosomal protein S20 [Staphylospora marina]